MPNTLSHYSNGIKKHFFLFLLTIYAFNSSFSQNAIVTENKIAGVPSSQWDLPVNGDGTFGDQSILGFGTDISVNKGSTIGFKITVTSGTNKAFGIKIYRIGYYQGNGARLMADLGTAFTGITQAACAFDNATGLTDCGAWTTTASWTVPSTAVSGIYIAKLTRSVAGGGGSSHIAFIVRDDASTSAVIFKTSDATWQAYNGYGGYSLYLGPGLPFNHGKKVSYNRPFITRSGGGGGGIEQDWFFNAEYPMVRFLERNGYDMSYTTDLDIARNNANNINLLLNHKIFLSVGHDEYWSKEVRNSVEAVRAAGKPLAFFSGNECYWKTRWENSIDGTNTPYRTMVCYKEGTLATPAENPCGGKCDPSPEWTGLWRDGCSFPSGNACKPENALSGEISWDGITDNMEVPATYQKLRFWRNSPITTLKAGQVAALSTGTLGYEWDWEQYPASLPPGRITMSFTSSDQGRIHKLSLYKSSFGGLVFGAGTVQWSWGLDASHDGATSPVNQSMQQATINILADMGTQPASLQSGLTAVTATTDVTPPVTTITSPANGATINSTSPLTISGTASDANTVAGVEISFDGGVTWTAATGTTSWTYTWTPPANGVYTIKARGIDDSGNYTAATSAATITLTIATSGNTNCPCTVFGVTTPTVTTLNDNNGGIVSGMKFRAVMNGTVTGIRFYKSTGNTGTHTGLLYNTSGTLLAQAVFSGETASGWQQVSFATPVSITGGQTYVAAYLSSAGNYNSTNSFFTVPAVNGPLTGLQDGTDGTNGVYVYSNTPAYPTNSFQQSNYWVDLIYNNVTAANAGSNQSITLPVSTVTLNGSGSTGNISSYAWTLVSGPNTPVITTPAAVSTTVTGMIQGTYIFQLSINAGASTSQTTVTVNPAPPPSANAGVRQSITLPVTIATLNGNGSIGIITSYVWTLVSGPNTPSITFPDSVLTTVTGLIQGIYVFQLSVNGGISTAIDSLTVNPAPPPTANAGSNQTITLPASSATLNGSLSAGIITSYVWTQVSGPNTSVMTTPAAVTTTVTGLIQGTYVYQLSVNGGVSVSQTSVSVVPAVTTTTIFTTQTPTTSILNDGQALELGVKFRTSIAGFVTGVRFYKSTGNAGTHTGELYSSTGTRLAQAVYTGETATGWQQVLFTTPVAIAANTTYVAAYFSSAGNYVNTVNFFATALVNGPVTGLADGTDGVNGVYSYSKTPALPTSSFQKSNYWVDVIFSSTPPPPTANAGANQSITLPVSTVTLNGSGSTGGISSYAWTLVSGPNTPVITTPAAVSTTVTGLIQGTYIFQLSLNGGVSTAKDTVIVNPVPPPTANAGLNQSITLPVSTVTLNGSASTGSISSYAWTLVSGPNTPVITTPAAVTTTVTGLIQGVYVYQLSINGGVSVSQTTVTVNPAPPPTANAGSNQTVTLPGSSATLNGSSSSGIITSYAWTQVSGPNTSVITTPAAVTTTVTGLIQGTYIYQLSVNGGVSVSQTSVSVVPAVTTTTIFTTQTPTSATLNDGQALELGVKFRTNVAGYVTGVRFYKSTGNAGTHTGELYSSTGTRLAQAVFTGETATGWQQVLFTTPVAITANTTYIAAYFSSAGNYVNTVSFFATALVDGPVTALADGTDGVNGVYSYSKTPAFPTSSFQKSNYWADVIFSSTPPPPTANAGANQSITLPVSTVTLNGSGSTGGISSYAWTLVSGPNTPVITTPATVSTTVTGLMQGTYIFQLSLNGGVSTSQTTITVNPVPPPVANAGSNQTVTLPASSATLNGSSSTGVITSYAWTQVSGPSTPLITTPAAVTTTVTGLIQGVYIYQLSINGGVSVSQTTVSVTTGTNYTIFTTQTTTLPTGNDGKTIEVGVKFRSLVSGFITGVRFYKTSGNTGTHTGELYSSAGNRLAQAIFTGETATGWQQVLFNTPVPVVAGTTYVAAYFSSAGNYVSTANYFTNDVVNGPLYALAAGEDGPNGVYFYTSVPAYPAFDGSGANYWVDAIFNGAYSPGQTIAPAVNLTSPASGATNIPVSAGINMFFTQHLDGTSVTANSVFLQSGANTIASTVTYNSADSSVTLTPSAPLTAGANYTMTVKGGTGASKIKNSIGTALTADSVWNFTTANPIMANPSNGPGGPILLISSTSNPFSRYPVEILRAEGWNAFNALDISAVTTTEINKYDAVILGDIPLTAAQVTILTNWVNAGGTLIAFSPDPQLAGLLGITSTGSTLSDKYLLVNTSSGPGVGIVNQTIQYHGSADLYTANSGTNVLATLYSDTSTATIYPAVTSRSVGTLGGTAIAFTYDLAKSVVYTRQGNPLWAGQKRDGNIPPIRSDDLFYGNASFDPEPDWVNLNKVAIPQADEQQRLLTNIILAGNFNRKPLPRFWFLPRGKKAAVVMTGDDHALGGTFDRMNQYLSYSSSNNPAAVANWDAIRSSSFMYPGSPITNAQIAFLQNQGFDLSVHVNPNCSVWTPADLVTYFSTQVSAFTSEYYAAWLPATHRIHCLAWADWASLPKTEIQNGIRFNVSYYYWPDVWVNDRAGMFTGSGMPMRFADTDGSLIDSYQATSQMTDESGQDYPETIASLLNNATGPAGYYGVFTANMHTDYAASPGSDAIVQTAQNLQIPVVSAKQMLDWLDGRNNSTFSNYGWSNNQLSFTVVQDPKAVNLKGMLPRVVSAGSFISLTQNGIAVPTTTDSIKGVSYVFFDAGSGNYVANYGATITNAQTFHLIPTEDTLATTPTYYLGQNYPNPFYQNTRINYSIPISAEVELVLYDMQGRPVKILVNEIKQPGNYEYDLNTASLAKGVYVYRMRSGNFTAVKKLIIE